jgi:hypothetical protein
MTIFSQQLENIIRRKWHGAFKFSFFTNLLCKGPIVEQNLERMNG